MDKYDKHGIITPQYRLTVRQLKEMIELLQDTDFVQIEQGEFFQYAQKVSIRKGQLIIQ